MTDLYPELNFPEYLLIETVRGCNARCPFCPLGAGQMSDTGLMPEDIYGKLEAEILLHADNIKRVTLQMWGEPLLDPQLEKRVARLKQGRIAEVALSSNAMLLSEARAEGLLRAGLDILRLSVSTVNPAKYPLLRRGLDLERVLANVEGAFALRDRLGLKTRVYVCMEKHEMLDDDDIRAWQDHWRRLVRTGDVLKIDECFDYTALDRTDLARLGEKPCGPQFRTLAIAFSGHAPLCCGDSRTADSPYLLGHAADQSLEEIWNGPAAKRYRQLHRDGRRDEIIVCRGCRIWSDEAKQNLSSNALKSLEEN